MIDGAVDVRIALQVRGGALAVGFDDAPNACTSPAGDLLTHEVHTSARCPSQFAAWLWPRAGGAVAQMASQPIVTRGRAADVPMLRLMLLAVILACCGCRGSEAQELGSSSGSAAAAPAPAFDPTTAFRKSAELGVTRCSLPVRA
jgi:hypothetical protein